MPALTYILYNYGKASSKIKEVQRLRMYTKNCSTFFYNFGCVNCVISTAIITPLSPYTATAAPRAKKVVQEEDDDLRELAAWAS